MSTKADRFKDRHKRFDPHFNDIPYDIIHDSNGRILGVVYTLPKRQLNDGKVRGVRE